MVLKCEKLCKKIGKKDILKNISFDLDSGDILGFIGPNGAGKTTTIKLILGLQSITSGSVSINGYDIKNNFEKAIEKVGTIVENPDLYMYMTGLGNLKLVARMYKNVDKKRIDEVVELVGLKNRINDKVSKYSLGMRQRLGIAQAIIHRPNLLILDEPTNGLDPEGIKDLRDLIVNLAKKEKMAIMVSSHNLAELESFCTKIAIIQNGVMIESSDINEAKKITKDSIFNFEVEESKEISKIIENVEIVDENNIRIKINKEQIPDLVENLVKNKIKIYSIVEEKLSLEDAFLKKIGGNVID